MTSSICWIIWCLCLAAFCILYWKFRQNERSYARWQASLDPEMLKFSRELRASLKFRICPSRNKCLQMELFERIPK